MIQHIIEIKYLLILILIILLGILILTALPLTLDAIDVLKQSQPERLLASLVNLG